MTTYQYERMAEATYIGFYTDVGGFVPRKGIGYFSGGHPDYITSVEGVPAACTVRVILRRRYAEPGDGLVVAEVTSGANGVWQVTGLDETKRYDVVCRYEGYNDMIISNVSPKV